MVISVPQDIQASQVQPGGKATLVAASQTVSPNSTLELGIYLQPFKGSHTYWINPGDSGGPTSFKLQLPQGWTQGKIQFPAPQRIDLSGVVSYGYESPTLLIVPIRIPARLSKAEYQILANVKWLTCTSEMCKPANQTVGLSLKTGTSKPSTWSSLFSRTEKQLPFASKAIVAVARKTADGIELKVDGIQPGGGAVGFYFYPSKPGLVDHSKPQVFAWKGSDLFGNLPKSPYAQKAVTQLTGVLTVGGSSGNGQKKSFAIDIPVQS